MTLEEQRLDWLRRGDRHWRDVEHNRAWAARNARDAARRATTKETK